MTSKPDNRNGFWSEQLKQLTAELTDLYHQQIGALENATFIGMTDQEAKAFEERRKRISELCTVLGKFNAAA